MTTGMFEVGNFLLHDVNVLAFASVETKNLYRFTNRMKSTREM